jgi:hypothetical protein
MYKNKLEDTKGVIRISKSKKQPIRCVRTKFNIYVYISHEDVKKLIKLIVLIH